MPEITKHDALRWLEMQRDAINTEIAYAAPSDKGQYFGNLKIVNWLVDRVKDMTAVEFFKALHDIHSLYCADGYCGDCPLSKGVGCHSPNLCGHIYLNYPVAVEVVKRWKEERDGND